MKGPARSWAVAGPVAAALGLLAPGPLGAQEAPGAQGYRLAAGQVVVESGADWEAWDAAPGVRLIGPEGNVSPRRLNRGINAVLDAGQFRYLSEGDTTSGGVLAAGTGRDLAALVMDGDPETCWEPAPDSPLDSWYVEVDLGRAVVADSMVVRFAEIGRGDPFLTFRLLASSGMQPGTVLPGGGYFRVGLATQPNKEQRVFSFPVEPQLPMPPGVSGEVLQFVRFQALSSDSARGQEVSPEAYQALAEGERGTVDYYRRTAGGRQIRVEREGYERLPEGERGARRYFRRERPALAEIEVYTLGDDVVRLTRHLRPAGATRREAALSHLRTSSITDGRQVTFRTVQEYDRIKDEYNLEIDLGARYWLDRIRLLSPANPPPAYQVRVSDGSLDASGLRVWQSLPERANPSAYLHLEERFPPQEVRYLDLRRLPLAQGRRELGYVSEVQAYGEGYVSEVVLTSPWIKLGRSRLFTTVDWSASTTPQAQVEVRTRSGDELLPVPHYYDIRGTELNKAAWERLPEDRKGPVEIEEVAGAGWSDWSPAYRQPGERFRSPNPRRYLQAQVRLASRDPLQAARLQGLRLGFVPPLVDQLFAEIWPQRQIPLGQEQVFTVYVRPVTGSGNPGFARLRLRSSSTAPVEILSVQAGTDRALQQGTATALWPGEVQVA
ncbi:MAG: hypothetical protein AB1505_11875 [Candidatus Latescibacterota bacterium]